MQTWKTWSVIVLVASATACKTAPTPAKPTPPATVTEQPPAIAEPPADALPAIPSAPIAEPAAVLVHATAGDLPALLPRLDAFTSVVQPGGGMRFSLDVIRMIAGQAGLDLSGVDLARPAHLLVLDPAQHAEPFVLVVAVDDRAALDAVAKQTGLRVLEHQGYAALGTHDALVAAGPYALSTLAVQPAAPSPRIEIAVDRGRRLVQDRFESALAEIVAAAPPEQRASMKLSVEGYAALLEQIDRAAFVLDVEPGRASVTIRLSGKPGTTLAAFIAAQRPAKLELLRELPAAPYVMGGALDLSTIWDFMTAVSAASMDQLYRDANLAGPMMAAWPKLLTGENAAALELGTAGPRLHATWDITDAAAVAAMWRDYFQNLAKTPLPGKLELKLKLDAGRHRGVKLSTMTIAPGRAMPAEERIAYDFFGGQIAVGYAVTDTRLMMGGGGDGVRAMKDAIDRGADRARTVDASLVPVVAELRARGESYLVAVDLVGFRDYFVAFAAAGPKGKRPALAPSTRAPAFLAIGRDGDELTFRVVVPATQLAPLL